MKKTWILTAALVAMMTLAVLPASAQITTTVTTIKHDSTFAMGRDFWFAEQSNYWGQDLGGKYMRIYITSPVNTTAYVESNGVKTPLPVTAYGIASFKVPEFWENESSGIVESKAIHVYSNDADLTVYNMSRNAYTSDGEYVIPSIGWGTDYVVAAYGSLFEGSGTYVYDLPSTCIVTADQDNTTVSITPSCDCRSSTSGNISGDANSTIVAFPANTLVTFTLNRGQCLQLMPIKAQDPNNYDMTGTIIHADKPIGVGGGSGCPNIPADRPYCDHVEDIMPPVRTWGETYYATNPIQPPGSFDDYARYLFISSKAGQTIFKNNCSQGSSVECKIDKQYGIFWDELEAGERFTSDAPFLCVWYINSATYPDGENGNGDPAESIINPKEQYTKTVVFETPTTVGNIVPFTNYANIICRKQDASKTLFDHKSILGHGASCLDDTFEVFNIPGIAPGGHIVQGPDTGAGVGVYLYGYGYDESYAWTTPSQCKTFQSPDSIAPQVSVSTICDEAFIHLSDTGLLASKLDQIRVDSIYNMTYLPDNKPFIEGSEVDTGGYGMYITDPGKPAILVVSVFDAAGNHTTITSSNAPTVGTVQPPLQNLGVCIAPKPANVAYDTIYNTGVTPFNITELQLTNSKIGFSIFDSTGGPLDLSPIPPGNRRLIQIKFQGKDSSLVLDTIVCGTSCLEQFATLIGGGGAADFFVTNQTWSDELLTSPPTCYPKTVTIYNFSTDSITIDNAFWKDDLHFQAISTFPVRIPPAPASIPFTIEYCPDSGSISMHDATQGSWTSPQVLDGGQERKRFDNLDGEAVETATTFVSSSIDTVACPRAYDTIPFTFTISATGNSPSIITRVTQSDPTDFVNFVGTLPNGDTWDPTTTSVSISPGQTATLSLLYIAKPMHDTTVVDTLTPYDVNNHAFNQPLTITVVAIYSAGSTYPTTLAFGPTSFQSQNGQTTKTFLIQNTSNASLQIEGMTLEEGGIYNSAFTLTPDRLLPFILPIGQSASVTVHFNDSVSEDPVQTAMVQISSKSSCTLLEDSLVAFLSGASVTQTNAAPLLATIVPMEDGRSLEIVVPAGISGRTTFELDNVLGESIFRRSLLNGDNNIDASLLPRGVYFYRLTFGGMSQSGKVILGE